MTRLCAVYDDYEAIDGGDRSSRTLRYNLYGATTNGEATIELGAQKYVYDNVPATFEGFYRASMRMRRKPDETGTNFDVEVEYTEFPPKTFIGYTHQFTAQSKSVTRTYAPVVSVLGQATTQTLEGAIAVDDKGKPQGASVDLADGTLSLTATLSKNQIFYNDLIQWYSMLNKVNTAAYGSYAAGELLFAGFQFRSGGAEKDSASFNFKVHPNESITVPLADTGGVAAWSDAQVYNPGAEVEFGDRVYICSSTTAAGESPLSHPAKWDVKTTAQAVAGHDYFTAGWQSFYDKEKNFKGARLRYTAVHRVYDWKAYVWNAGNGTGWSYLDRTADLLPPSLFSSFAQP